MGVDIRGVYWSFTGTAVGPTPQAMTSDPTRKKRALTAAWIAVARELRAQGHRVHFVQEVPKHAASGFVETTSCPTVSVVFDRCGSGTPRFLIERNQGHAWEAYREIGRQAGANVIEVVDWFCSSTTCSTVKGGTSSIGTPGTSPPLRAKVWKVSLAPLSPSPSPGPLSDESSAVAPAARAPTRNPPRGRHDLRRCGPLHRPATSVIRAA